MFYVSPLSIDRSIGRKRKEKCILTFALCGHFYWPYIVAESERKKSLLIVVCIAHKTSLGSNKNHTTYKHTRTHCYSNMDFSSLLKEKFLLVPFNHFFYFTGKCSLTFSVRNDRNNRFSIHFICVFNFRVRPKSPMSSTGTTTLLHLCGCVFQSFSANSLHVVVTIKIRRFSVEQIDKNSHKSIVHTTIQNVRYVFAAFSRSFLSVCFCIVHGECISKTMRGKRSGKKKCQNSLKS